MASAQLLYNINTTKTKKYSTTTKATATTTIQSIEHHHHHYKEQLSIFCKAEVKREQGIAGNISTNSINNNNNNTNRKQSKSNRETDTNNFAKGVKQKSKKYTNTSKKSKKHFTLVSSQKKDDDDIEKNFVFDLEDRQQRQQLQQAWPVAIPERKWSFPNCTSTTATKAIHADDVVVGGVHGQHIATTATIATARTTTDIDKKVFGKTISNHFRKCRQILPNNRNRTIQPTHTNDDVFIHDYAGIEDFKIHTKNNTNMPINNNNNHYSNTDNNNNKTIIPSFQPASGPELQNSYKIKTYNTSTTTKCCQTNVANESCHNQCLSNNHKQFESKHSIANNSLRTPFKKSQQQQRNVSTNSFNSTTTLRKQQQHKYSTFYTITSNSTSTKFFWDWDFQKMAKYLLSLLVIFNMLPLFYAECDQTFVSRIGGPQNGTFSAPLLHNLKNHSRQCLYTFLAGPGQRVKVVFKTFNLRGSPPDGSAVGELPSCVHEYMDIYSEVQSSEPAELINSPFGGRYCGTIPPRQRISMYRAVAISFFTNKNITTPDLFEGTFQFINASEYEIGIPIAGSPCSYTITPSLSINKTGVLISPTYPGAYPKDMSCTYQFLGESNQRVRLEFRDFDLFFGGPHCPFDYVKVYDGPDNSSALIGTYCGQQRNLVLYSSESSLFVHFFTLSRTANSQNRGFKGIYEFSESFVKLDFIRENDGIHIRGSECDQKILSRKESTGFVLSPNYPYPYIPKTVCRYFIYGMQDAQHLERVRLEFTAFNIPRVESKDKDKETNCSDGYLKIYLKGQETADAYDKFDYELCGNETQRVVSDGPRLAMVFSSGELQGRGFKGKYIFETEYKIPGTAAPDGSCSFTYVSSSKKRGELNSPRYPSNYPSDTNCSYLFLAEPNEQVTIVFDHFKIKSDGNSNVTAGAYGSVICFEDWLEMYVVYRDNNDRFLGRYCGMTAPGPVESPRGAVGLRITLHTDQENVASGFKARYFFETAKSEIGDCGGNFSNEDSGIIASPNYPAGYKAPGRGMASMACNWLMTARPGYKLSIHFEHFSLEGDPANRGCPAAVLRLWVNVDSDQPPLELCGEKPPIEQWHYISTGQTARISFTTSDKTVGAPGFRIVWTEIQDSGPGPPSIGLLCESTYHFQCEVGYCISDKLRCDGVKNCGPNDDSDELHCESYHKSASGGSRRSNYNNTSRRLVPNLSPMHTLSLQKKT